MTLGISTDQRQLVIDTIDEYPMHALVISNLCDALRRGKGDEALVKSVLANLPTSSGYISLRLDEFLGSDSVFGTMTVGEELVESLLSDRFFVSGHQKFTARDYAISSGYQIASRSVNEILLNDLLEKQNRNTLTDVEVTALDIYIRNDVCDCDGRLSVRHSRVFAAPHERATRSSWQAYASRPFGWLMVRSLVDSDRLLGDQIPRLRVKV